MIRVGYIQLVEEDLKPVGDRVACLMDYRPTWHGPGPDSEVKADLYFRQRTVTLTSGYKIAKMGLFNNNYELIMILWPQYYVHGALLRRGGGKYVIANKYYDPSRGLWTTRDTNDQIDDIYNDIITHLD